MFRVNLFFCVLDIIINQLRLRFLAMKESIYNFHVVQPATSQNFNDTNLLGKALEFVEIYKKNISASFAKEILCFRSTFRHETEKSTCIRELADLLFIKNHFMSCSFPEV